MLKFICISTHTVLETTHYFLVMLTVFLPIYKIDGLRKRNLEFLYERLLSCDFKIVFAVQAEKIDEYYSRFKKARVINFFGQNCVGGFNKNFLINRCLEMKFETDFIMILDADVYFSFAKLKNKLRSDDEVVKPFSECVYFDSETTAEFILKREATTKEEFRRISSLGGGATIIRADLLSSKPINLDEEFSGWGWEDIDFGDQLRAEFKVRTIDQPAVHLYHEPSVPNFENHLYYKTKKKKRFFAVHTFNSDGTNKHLIEEYLAKKDNSLLLMNCSDIDFLNNDSIKFSHVSRHEDDFCINDVVNCSLEYLEDNGWAIYTDQEFFKESLYETLKKEARDYVCFAENPGAFAVRKRLWIASSVPKIVKKGDWVKGLNGLFGC